MFRASAVVLCLFWALGESAGAQAVSRQASAPYTRVDLIASDAVATPGSTLWIGLRFQLDPGWHVYWRNPGDSGNAPALRWQLPEDVRAGEIVWPAPERIPTGTLVNYGYDGGVVLPVPLTIPKGAAGAVAVGLQVKWLVCQELCVSGQARLELKLPLGAAEKAEVAGWKRAIDQARAREPRPAPAAWAARAVSLKDDFVVTIDTGARETQGVFFPLELSQINDSAPQRVRALDRGLELTLRKSDQLRADPAELTGVLALPGKPAYVITARVGKEEVRSKN
jgi:thiol:disulfide interchange protein DsbD